MERNIPPLVDNIIPAVKKAIADNPNAHGSDVIPYAIEENIWQGIEDLFMASPASRHLVNAGKAKVVGAIYDVSNGKIDWLPEAKTTEILKERWKQWHNNFVSKFNKKMLITAEQSHTPEVKSAPRFAFYFR